MSTAVRQTQYVEMLTRLRQAAYRIKTELCPTVSSAKGRRSAHRVPSIQQSVAKKYIAGLEQPTSSPPPSHTHKSTLPY